MAIDCGTTAPACFLADKHVRVSCCGAPEFSDEVLNVCKANAIGLVVPTIDTELPVYAGMREEFYATGVTIAISSPETVAICCDKSLTHKWLISNGFPTVRQAALSEAVREVETWRYPVILKPVKGSASIGVRLIPGPEELEKAHASSSGAIVQEKAEGREFTINVYVNRRGKCICAIPHLRMEVRAGEVSKGITVKNKSLMSVAKAVAQKLPGAWGPLNIQCFLANDGAIRIIEINARFGGGYPLAHRAGAVFTEWLLKERDEAVDLDCDDWEDGLMMLRYDEAVFVATGGGTHEQTGLQCL